MIDLGDPWPNLSVTTYNAAGVAENATTVVLTVTLPDGTTVTPAVTAAGAGVYTASYTPTLPGRHTARWVATGVNASAFTDAIDVDEAASAIVSLADAREFLNFKSTDNDGELRDVLDEATEIVEGWIGPVVRRSLTVTVQPTGGLLFLDPPSISLTSITAANGYTGTYTVGDYTLAGKTGIVRANNGVSTFTYPVTVTHVAGRMVVEAVIRRATKTLIRGLWASQRVAGVTPGMRAADDAEQPFSPFLLARAEAKQMLEDADLLSPPAVA